MTDSREEETRKLHEARKQVPPDEVQEIVGQSLTSSPARSGPFAEETGAFSILLRTSGKSANPGSVLTVECYVTGYGVIRAAKLLALCPYGILEPGKSQVHDSFGPIGKQSDGSPQWGFGRLSRPYDEGKGPVVFMGIRTSGFDETTAFFDLNFASRDRAQMPSEVLATEMKIGRAPVEYELHLSKKARTGDHTLQIALTYFNGHDWCISEKEISFRVSTWWERNQGWLSVVGVVVGVIGLLALVR